VWFFFSKTEDCQIEGDIESKADDAKMEKVWKLIFFIAMELGNNLELLKLDLCPKIRARGEENLKVEGDRDLFLFAHPAGLISKRKETSPIISVRELRSCVQIEPIEP